MLLLLLLLLLLMLLLQLGHLMLMIDLMRMLLR